MRFLALVLCLLFGSVAYGQCPCQKTPPVPAKTLPAAVKPAPKKPLPAPKKFAMDIKPVDLPCWYAKYLTPNTPPNCDPTYGTFTVTGNPTVYPVTFYPCDPDDTLYFMNPDLGVPGFPPTGSFTFSYIDSNGNLVTATGPTNQGGILCAKKLVTLSSLPQ